MSRVTELARHVSDNGRRGLCQECVGCWATGGTHVLCAPRRKLLWRSRLPYGCFLMDIPFVAPVALYVHGQFEYMSMSRFERKHGREWTSPRRTLRGVWRAWRNTAKHPNVHDYWTTRWAGRKHV